MIFDSLVWNLFFPKLNLLAINTLNLFYRSRCFSCYEDSPIVKNSVNMNINIKHYDDYYLSIFASRFTVESEMLKIFFNSFSEDA